LNDYLLGSPTRDPIGSQPRDDTQPPAASGGSSTVGAHAEAGAQNSSTEELLDWLWDDLITTATAGNANKAKAEKQHRRVAELCARIWVREQHDWSGFLKRRGVQQPKETLNKAGVRNGLTAEA